MSCVLSFVAIFTNLSLLCLYVVVIGLESNRSHISPKYLYPTGKLDYSSNNNYNKYTTKLFSTRFNRFRSSVRLVAVFLYLTLWTTHTILLHTNIGYSFLLHRYCSATKSKKIPMANFLNHKKKHNRKIKMKRDTTTKMRVRPTDRRNLYVL